MSEIFESYDVFLHGLPKFYRSYQVFSSMTMHTNTDTVLKNLSGTVVVVKISGLQPTKHTSEYNKLVSDNSKGISNHLYCQKVNRISKTNN